MQKKFLMIFFYFQKVFNELTTCWSTCVFIRVKSLISAGKNLFLFISS